MSTNSLLETMTEEVARQRASVLESAQSESESILAKAREDAAQRRKRAVETAEAELTETVQRERERTESEAEMKVLTAKDTITDEILAEVAVELSRVVEKPEFPALLEALLSEALADTPKAEVVLAPPAHVEHCRGWLAANGHGALEVRGMDSLLDGIAVQDKQRSFRVTNTFSARLENQEGRLRKLCVARLLPGESTPDDGTAE